MASDRLTILPVLYLHPGRRFRRVFGACLLRDNPLHVALANHAEQFRAAREVLQVQNRSRPARKQLPKRLRRKLEEYYDNDGKTDPVIVTFPAGSYVPVFARPQARERHLSPQTIAVLPFKNVTADPSQDYFCDGLSEDIIHALSRVQGLNVIGHTSTLALKGVEARDAGARVGAGTVVDGTLRKSDGLLKVFAEVVNASNGEVRWSASHVADMRNLNDVPTAGFYTVICMDNALPHLLSETDLAQAAVQIRAKLRSASRGIRSAGSAIQNIR